MIGTCSKCGLSADSLSRKAVIEVMRSVLDEVGENASRNLIDLQRTLERTLAAMAQADVVANLAADRVLRSIRGPMAKLRRLR